MNPTTVEINGTVTDANSAPIVGATLHFGSQTVNSTQNGAYIIPNVTIPAGQTSLVGNVTASATVKGVAYSGQNQVEALATDPITRNVQIVLSPTATQGSILGVVVDTNGNRVPGARVFANVGPFSQPATPTQQFFISLGSFNTTARSDGSFTLPALPPDNQYTVTASFAGYINQTTNNIAVLASSSTNVTLTLTKSTTGSSPPAPTGLFAQTITAPLSPTRAAGTAGTSEGFLNVIRQILLQKRGMLGHRAAAAQQIVLHRSITRDTPSGSLIETDVFWDYVQLDNLFGYDIIRATTLSPANFVSIATVRDPLADRFADNDPILTPDVPYYYSIARLDTINFPKNQGGIGDAVQPPVTVEPLNVLSLVSPASGSVTSATPTFTWSTVTRAALYKALVYDQFPTLQSDTDPNGVAPIWSADFSGTTGTYAGPALISGHTYYWAVLGQDSVASAFTISPLQTFVAP
ncbi:MAG: Carboxypeptidase regulatory-like domain [Chthonomonadaceae bacterium]|nr:Carboxypeptidase regulatory-like domain [Chthonomonadaceae bacterium]